MTPSPWAKLKVLAEPPDRLALAIVMVLTLASLVVSAATQHAEVVRNRMAITGGEIWLLEATSHGAILALLPLLPRLLDRARPARERWAKAALWLALGAGIFFVGHILLMWALRVSLFPLVLGWPYSFNLFRPSSLFYEAAKDLFTYTTLLIPFLFMRLLGERRRALAAQGQAAASSGRITLRSGSSSFTVAAVDVLWAKAAANYVEVHTASRSFLARMTLAGLESELAAAGGRHARVHRSYVINTDALLRVTPTGDGDVEIELTTGIKIPGSRRYRGRLPGERD